MRAMTIRAYGTAEEVFQEETITPDSIGRNDVLVKIHASSVNPIEYKMRQGYGRRVFRKKRGQEFPAVLGNDVCGQVEKCGKNVAHLQPGDWVYAAPEVRGQGSYCQYRSINAKHCSLKPINLSAVEAATIPYVAMTCWDALVVKAKLTPFKCQGLRVFVHGGSGGIGGMAIQLLKAWGAEVSATCSAHKQQRLIALGTDRVINYQSQDYSMLLQNVDLFLDCVGEGADQYAPQILRRDGRGQFVTLILPALAAIDQYGFIKGGWRILKALREKKSHFKNKSLQYHWATFKSRPECLAHITPLIERGQVCAQLDRAFKLADIASAHNYVESGKAFGKVGIEIEH